jgi:hypothetical protein
MRLVDYPKAKFIKAVLAGQPGRGKTSAGLSFPTPMLIFDFDGKLTGPIYYAQKLGVNLEEIEVETPADYGRNWEKLATRLLSFRDNPGKYKTFGFDSLTSIADFLLGMTGEVKAKTKPDEIKKVGGIQVPAIDEYNAETAGIMDILLFMKDVQANVWLTAHVLESKATTLDNRLVISRSLLTGGRKVSAKIPAYFPENYAFNVEYPIDVKQKVHYVCYTKTTGEDYARTELPLPEKIDFTDELFFKKLVSYLE